MRVYKTKWLARFARREQISDLQLAAAVARIEQGLIDADLGGGIIKQRVARTGQGRSAGYRLLIAYRIGNRAVFLYGFAKNERGNIDPDELRIGNRAVFLYGFAKNERGNIDPDELLTLRDIGQAWLAADADGLDRALADGLLQEAIYDDENR